MRCRLVFCREAYCCAVKPSPLLEGGEESCIQNVFLRLPSAVPGSPQQRREVIGTKTDRGPSVSSRTSAVGSFNQSHLAPCPAITGYVTDSDAWWTQPLLKLVWTLTHPSELIPAHLQHLCGNTQGARRPADCTAAPRADKRIKKTTNKQSDDRVGAGAVVRAARMERCPSLPLLLYSLLRPALPFHEIFPATLQKQTRNRLITLSHCCLSALHKRAVA